MAWDSDEYEANPEGFKQKFKSMVSYGKGSDRGLTGKDKMDGRDLGLGHEECVDHMLKLIMGDCTGNKSVSNNLILQLVTGQKRKTGTQERWP